MGSNIFWSSSKSMIDAHDLRDQCFTSHSQDNTACLMPGYSNNMREAK